MAGVGRLVYTNDYLSRACLCTPKGPKFANKNANDGQQKWQVQFHAYDPFWYYTTPSTSTIGYLTSANSANLGQYQTPITAVIYGPVVNPRIIKTSTLEYIWINKTILAGDFVTINTAFGNKTITVSTSGVISNGMPYLANGSTFFNLSVGANNVYYDRDSGTPASATLTWTNRDLGV